MKTDRPRFVTDGRQALCAQPLQFNPHRFGELLDRPARHRRRIDRYRECDVCGKLRGSARQLLEVADRLCPKEGA